MATQLEGDFRELYAKLGALSSRLQVRALRGAVRRAARITLNKARSLATLGTEAHRTYKRRLVSPGFLRRSLRVITKVTPSEGKVAAIIGVRKEAFYGPQFYDQGPYTITRRRYKRSGRKSRAVRQIKPYTLRKRPWFESAFDSSKQQMENDFVQFLRQEIDKAVKRGN